VVETYLAHLRETASLKRQFDGGEAAAARHGRRFESEGVHGSVIVRETRQAALDYFYGQIDATGVEHTRERLEGRVRSASRGRTTLSDYTAPDAVRQRIVDRVLSGRLPAPGELELEPGVYAGQTPWSGFDIFGDGAGVYLVGSGDDVAGSIGRIQEASPLVDTFIFSAWPLVQESTTVAQLLLPRLGIETADPLSATA
jgi:hypothetical protein